MVKGQGLDDIVRRRVIKLGVPNRCKHTVFDKYSE